MLILLLLMLLILTLIPMLLQLLMLLLPTITSTLHCSLISVWNTFEVVPDVNGRRCCFLAYLPKPGCRLLSSATFRCGETIALRPTLIRIGIRAAKNEGVQCEKTSVSI